MPLFGSDLADAFGSIEDLLEWLLGPRRKKEEEPEEEPAEKEED